MILKKSFTLSEIMISIAVLGVIVAACVPIILSMTPNKNAIMIRKAYYTTEQIVSDLINDENYFPDGDLSDTTPTPLVGTGITPFEGYKFRCLFASKLNIDDSNTYHAQNEDALEKICLHEISTTAGNAEGLIYTNDGMIWNFVNCPISNSTDNWEKDGCRIDISTTHDIIHSGYDTGVACMDDGNGWGATICGVKLVHKIGKMAMFIDKNGNISLNGRTNTNGGNGMMTGEHDQENIRTILNGTTSLMGK